MLKQEPAKKLAASQPTLRYAHPTQSPNLATDISYKEAWRLGTTRARILKSYREACAPKSIQSPSRLPVYATPTVWTDDDYTSYSDDDYTSSSEVAQAMPRKVNLLPRRQVAHHGGKVNLRHRKVNLRHRNQVARHGGKVNLLPRKPAARMHTPTVSTYDDDTHSSPDPVRQCHIEGQAMPRTVRSRCDLVANQDFETRAERYLIQRPPQRL